MISAFEWLLKRPRELTSVNVKDSSYAFPCSLDFIVDLVPKISVDGSKPVSENQ